MRVLFCGRNTSQYVPAGIVVCVTTGWVFHPATGVNAAVSARRAPGAFPLFA